MVIYLLSLSLLIILGIIIFSIKNLNAMKKKKIFLFVCFFVFFLLMGFRTENVGTDTKLYCTIFNKYSKMSVSSIICSGDSSIIYALYNKIVSFFSISNYAIIVANSFIICLLTVIFIKNNSKHVVLSSIYFCTFYHFFNAMNISRQYIAVMMVANSIIYLKNKNIVRYLVLNIVAVLIHNTAIISFIMVPWFFIEKNKKNMHIFLLCLFFSAFFFDKLLLLFTSTFTHYDLYFSNNLINDVGANKKIIITIIYIFIAIIIKFILEKIDDTTTNEYSELYLYYLMNFVAIILGVVALKTMLITRIEMYFSIFAIVYIPEILSKFKEKEIINIFFMVMMFIPMLVQLVNNNNGILPYENWLFQILLK